MPPKLLFPVDDIDLDAVAVPLEDIQKINPQRYEFSQLTKICYLNTDDQHIVGVRDVKEDEFWVRGHMPGRPIFPGVLMLETAAQLCSVYTGLTMKNEVTYGFGGCDSVRFRKLVTIGDRLVILAKAETVSPRRSRCWSQGLVNGDIVFEASIFGIALPPEK